MKKTFNINLNNQVFCVDEDACIQLQNYIETLEKYYLKEEDGKEIMADIESRIAELFSEFLVRYHKQVISQPDIDRIIEIMGSPDIIINEDTEHASIHKNINHKLYRDKENAILGGVAAGLSAYFSISMIWVRLAFILLAFLYGVTIIAYIILWIVIPKAITAKQKLEMKGENINVSNIEKKIRDTYNEVKKNSKYQQTLNHIGEKTSILFSTSGKVIQNIMSVTGHIFAVIGLLAGIFSFLMVCWGIFFSFHILPDNYYLFFQYFCAPIPVELIKLILFCLLNIPIFLIIYYSASYLFKFYKAKNLLLPLGILWIASCFMGIFLSIYYITNNAHSYKNETEISLMSTDTIQQKVLNVKFNWLCKNHYQSPYLPLEDYLLHCPGQSEDSSILYFQPRIYFQKTNFAEPQLLIIKKARSFSSTEAAYNQENICYEYKWQNDTLSLNNYFTLYNPRLRANTLEIRILIPENYQLNLQNPLRYELKNPSIFRNPQKFLKGSSAYQQFVMKNGKLVSLSK